MNARLPACTLVRPSEDPEIPQLGGDPGNGAGGVCLVLPGRVVGLQATWTQRRRKGATVWEMTVARRNGTVTCTEHRSLWHALLRVSSGEDARFVGTVERVHAIPGKASPEVLIESAGILRAWMLHIGCEEPRERPRPVDWRRDVLLLNEKQAGAQACETAAIRAYSDVPGVGDPAHRQWGLTRSQALSEALSGHAAEACGIALWSGGWRMREGG